MAGFHLKIAFTTIALIFSASVSYGSTCKAITVELIPSCSNETICKWMGYVESGTNLGDKLSYALNTQARQRGLNCAREESFGKPSTPLRDAFVGFTKEKRTTIQSKLAAIELYTSTIDGLWGKGTETALQRYNSKYLSNLDLSKVDNLRFLYHKILTKDLVDEPDLSIEKTNSVGAECADDPNECTLKKLCEVATALDGGNRIWSTEASSAKHVNTAQILGMECGITSIVDPCDTDPSECKLSQICGKATTESSGQVSWDDSAAAYVALAKEYGLGCDVNDEAESVVEWDCQKNPQSCSDQRLCEEATVGAYGDTPSWAINFFSKKDHIEEAKRRGLSCGVGEEPKVEAVKNNGACQLKTPEYCADDILCENTTIKMFPKTVWTENLLFQGWVTEAKARGLSCGVNSAGTCSYQKLEYCDDDDICSKATYGSMRKFWQSSDVSVAEAKKRGLTCGVDEEEAAAVVTIDVLKQAFTSEPKLYRQQLQYALTKLGFYSYGVDGRWGNGTSAAFDKFVKGYKLQSSTEVEVFRSLLNKVTVPSSFTSTQMQTTPAKTSQDNAGLTSIISNPSVTGKQALAICRPQAKLAKSQASAGAGSGSRNRRRTYDIDCSFGSCRATDVTPSGGMWGGIHRALTAATAGKNAYNAVMDACLAQYGWSD